MQEATKWVTRQRWEHVQFLHFTGAAEVVRSVLPKELELDCWQNEAVLSVVPFRMTRVRFPGVPSIPVLSNLWELNLRTYVKYKSQRGVYFFTLESSNPLATWVARTFFSLPYANSKLQVNKAHQDNFHTIHRRGNLSCEIVCDLKSGVEFIKNDFSDWATERYCLFNVKKYKVYRGTVFHNPWKLNALEVKKFEGNFLSLVPNADSFKLYASSYCRLIDVSFKAFEIMGT